jgi:hypothetical protein
MLSVFTLGMGSRTSCGQFIAATEGHKLNKSAMLKQDGTTFWSANALMLEWVYGALTAVNVVGRDQNHQIQNDNPAIELWLRNWCTKHPTSTLPDAVGAFVAATPGTPLK